MAGARDAPYLPSPQDGAGTRQQLPRTGPCDVIVRAKFEADDTVDFVGAIAGDDDGNIRVRTDRSQLIPPFILAKLLVHDDEGRRRAGAFQLAPVGCGA